MSAPAMTIHPTISTVPLMRAIAPSHFAEVMEIALLQDEARRHLDQISDAMDRAETHTEFVVLLSSERAAYDRNEILERRLRIALSDFEMEMTAVARPFRDSNISKTESAFIREQQQAS